MLTSRFLIGFALGVPVGVVLAVGGICYMLGRVMQACDEQDGTRYDHLLVPDTVPDNIMDMGRHDS